MLGQIYQSIPWDDLSKSLKLKENRSGRKAMFSPQGKLALMFLKSYSDTSDQKVYEQLNGNIQWQIFCGIILGSKKLKEYKVISRIRTELAKKLDIRDAQGVLAKTWKPFMEQTNIVLEDATCYESDIRYPTNVKLLWECVYWMQGLMKRTCKYLKIPTPRSKLLEQKEKYFDYARKKKKPWKVTVKRTRSLLHLLDKLIYEQ